MRVAFVSFEFPPDTRHGGIATYLDQAVRMLSQAGHDVEVFAGSRVRSGEEPSGGGIVHRIQAAEFAEFAEKVPAVVAGRHQCRPFDVVEAPEFQVEYRHLAREIPNLPLVVKLHTPTFKIRQLMTEG